MTERVELLPTNYKYTICFPRVGSRLLMVYRYNEPHKSLWNGLGGKLEPDETPRKSIFREMDEEAKMDLSQATDVYFAGVVTWNKEDGTKVGMYAFIADLPDDYETWEEPQETREGLLSWKGQEWASDQSNTEVVENIPHFLPPMLRKDLPMEYFCELKDGKMIGFKVLPMVSTVPAIE